MKKFFPEVKINFGVNFNFKDRLNLVSVILSSKAVQTALRDNIIPVYCFVDGDRKVVGTVGEFKSKVIARSIGSSSVHFFADILLDTKDDFVIDRFDKYVSSHKQSYRLSFITSNTKTPSDIIKGLIIRLGV